MYYIFTSLYNNNTQLNMTEHTRALVLSCICIEVRGSGICAVFDLLLFLLQSVLCFTMLAPLQNVIFAVVLAYASIKSEVLIFTS